VLRSFSLYRHARAYYPDGTVAGTLLPGWPRRRPSPDVRRVGSRSKTVSRPAWRSLTFGPAGSRGR